MVKITFVLITARGDYPYTNRPELHVFEPTVESMKSQTFRDFELVTVDVLYEKRKNYFAEQQLPFKVKHVPALPNLWIEKGFPGIATQYNKGIIYADGELIFFTGDGFMFRPEFMERMWNRYQQGYFPLSWYMYDQSFSEIQYTSGRLDVQSAEEKYKVAYPDKDNATPIPYDICGYTGKKVSIEHRYTTAFKNPDTQVFPAPWLWWFGCSSASREAMLKINGFDQNFDGDRMLLDTDVGGRLDIAGYGARLALFRDFFMVRAPTDPSVWNPALNKACPTIKCNYPFTYRSRFHGQYRANMRKLTEQDVAWIKEIWCAKHCPIRELCKREHPWQYPFIHKAGFAGHDSDEKWFQFWMQNQTLIDLKAEREKRIQGTKYTEGTYT